MNIYSIAWAENLTIAPKGVTTLIPNLGNFISAGVATIFLISFLVFLIMLIWGGVEWITSGGDKENVQKAKSRITNALIGVAIVASTWGITKAVEWFFCINILGNIQLPSAVEGSPSGGGGRCGSGGGGGGGSSNWVNDGGSGHYCRKSNGEWGAAWVQWHQGNDRSGHLSYPHYDPCQCIEGNQVSGYDFSSCN